MQPCPGEPMCTVVQGEGWYAGVWVAGQRDLGVQQKETMGPGKLGERNTDFVPGIGSAIALLQAGGCLAGNGSTGKELCCRKKLLSSCSLKQIKIEAVHLFISNI